MRLRQVIAGGSEDTAGLAGTVCASDVLLDDGACREQDSAFGIFTLTDDEDPLGGDFMPDWHADPETLIGEVLALHHVPALLAERILGAIREAGDRLVGDPLGNLAGGLASCLGFAPFGRVWRGGAVALVGPPGAGKTTVAAKLAARSRRGLPLLLNTDVARAGAAEQLGEAAEALGAELATEADIEAIARASRNHDRLIVIDTSGINPFDDGAMHRLAAIIAAARAEPILVLPANLAPDEAVAVARAFRALPLRRLVVTRLDIVRRLGGALAAAEAGGYDLVAGSVTPHLSFGLRPLTPTALSRRLLSAALDNRRWRTGPSLERPHPAVASFG